MTDWGADGAASYSLLYTSQPVATYAVNLSSTVESMRNIGSVVNQLALLPLLIKIRLLSW